MLLYKREGSGVREGEGGGGDRFQSSWEQVRAASIQKRWVIIDWKESMTQVTK